MKRLNKDWFNRWTKGGLWIKHNDANWIRGNWNSGKKEYIIDEHGDGYHKTLVTITDIEDYPVRHKPKTCICCGQRLQRNS